MVEGLPDPPATDAGKSGDDGCLDAAGSTNRMPGDRWCEVPLLQLMLDRRWRFAKRKQRSSNVGCTDNGCVMARRCSIEPAGMKLT